jgi:hypothetical protein
LLGCGGGLEIQRLDGDALLSTSSPRPHVSRLGAEGLHQRLDGESIRQPIKENIQQGVALHG